MQRRYFLGAAAVAARAAITPASKVNIAIMGVRGRGRALAGEFAKLDDVNIPYLCDVDPRVVERAMKAVEEKKGRRPELIGDVRRALDDRSVDAIVIAAPDHWHAPATLLACEAGKDVYVEKPASHNLREGRLMIEAARRHKRVVQVGTQARSRPVVRRAVELVHAGRLGKVLMAKAWNVQLRENIGRKPDSAVPAGVDFDAWTGPAPFLPFNENRFHYNWHWNWNYGTGDMGNDGVHQMDIARWALDAGAPLEAAGSARKLFFDDDQQTPDTMNITFSYPGKVLQFEMRIWNPYRMVDIENGVEVYGNEGMMQIGKLESKQKWAFRLFDAKGKVAMMESADETDGHARNFIDCVRSRKAPNADIEIGHTSTLHCHLGNIVARTGRTIRFDPATETIAGDAEAGRYLRREYRKHWSAPKGA
jgi:predicted dehydrogenase